MHAVQILNLNVQFNSTRPSTSARLTVLVTIIFLVLYQSIRQGRCLEKSKRVNAFDQSMKLTLLCPYLQLLNQFCVLIVQDNNLV